MVSFEEAKEAVLSGKKAYRSSNRTVSTNHWNGQEEVTTGYLYVFADGMYRIQTGDYQSKLMREDLEAQDWVIEDVQTHEAIK